MIGIKQTRSFRKWREKLKDKCARGLIASRLARLAHGHFGDTRPLVGQGKGISELSIDSGPGYRIYFRKQGDTIIVLLCGGNKSTQARDIKTAKRLLAKIRERTK